jgi:hypothetical protein
MKVYQGGPIPFDRSAGSSAEMTCFRRISGFAAALSTGGYSYGR